MNSMTAPVSSKPRPIGVDQRVRVRHELAARDRDPVRRAKDVALVVLPELVVPLLAPELEGPRHRHPLARPRELVHLPRRRARARRPSTPTSARGGRRATRGDLRRAGPRAIRSTPRGRTRRRDRPLRSRRARARPRRDRSRPRPRPERPACRPARERRERRHLGRHHGRDRRAPPSRPAHRRGAGT